MLLELEHVTKRFGAPTSRAPLDDVSFAVDAGEVVGLAGPNGAGKTTLIRLLMGFLAPDSGRVSVFGHDACRRRHLSEVGWMSERPSFPPGWRVADVMRFQATTFPTWNRDVADGLVDRLALDPAQRAASLSRGQLGRLSLVLALAHRPRLLLLDDPCLGLDPGGRRILLGELLGAAADDGCGILLSTHLLAEVEPALDRLVLLDGGRVSVDERVDALRSSALVATAAALTRRWTSTGANESPRSLEDLFVEKTGTLDRR